MVTGVCGFALIALFFSALRELGWFTAMDDPEEDLLRIAVIGTVGLIFVLWASCVLPVVA